MEVNKNKQIEKHAILRLYRKYTQTHKSICIHSGLQTTHTQLHLHRNTHTKTQKINKGKTQY